MNKLKKKKDNKMINIMHEATNSHTVHTTKDPVCPANLVLWIMQ